MVQATLDGLIREVQRESPDVLEQLVVCAEEDTDIEPGLGIQQAELHALLDVRGSVLALTRSGVSFMVLVSSPSSAAPGIEIPVPATDVG